MACRGTIPGSVGMLKELWGLALGWLPMSRSIVLMCCPCWFATDGAIAAFGHDGRRLRPNIVISGVEGLAERSWPGQCLRIGNVIIGIQDLRGRCIMTTFDPDNLKQDRQVLTEIVKKFDGTLALNCDVLQGGEIRVGDAVELVPEHECAAIRG